MCIQPIRVKNPSRYYKNGTGQQRYIWVNCGECSECRQQRQNEWTTRTFYHMLEAFDNNQYLYFDTLTYNNENLPKLSKYLKDCNQNYSCFNYDDIRNFYEKLRDIYPKGSFTYFITSEYGELRHRPHYHIIIFIDNDFDPLELSKNIAHCWNKGRTDGQPYKSKMYVLEHNVINKINYNAIRYVTKYVTKNQHFTDVINKRWIKLENLYKNHFNKDKQELKILKRKYFHHCGTFHRQSQHYGEAALEYISEEEIIRTNEIYYKNDDINIIKKCSLPMYFKRKLWQQQIKYKGKRLWVYTEKGKEAKKAMEELLYNRIKDRIKSNAATKGIKDIDIDRLATYILYVRGRFEGVDDYENHIKEAEYYNYSSDRDYKYTGKRGISKVDIGNDAVGYCPTEWEDVDIEELVQYDEECEQWIREIEEGNEEKAENDKKKVLLDEHLRELKKTIFNQGVF